MTRVKQDDLMCILLEQLQRLNIPEDSKDYSKEQMEFELKRASAVVDVSEQMLEIVKLEQQEKKLQMQYWVLQERVKSNSEGIFDARQMPKLNSGFFGE
jgi:hypothetical protein